MRQFACETILADHRRALDRALRLLAIPLLLVFALPAFAKHELNSGEITAEIQDKLYHAKIPQHGNVQVNFDNGVATLTGTVDSLGAKEDAIKAVHKVDDVNQIVDH